MKHWTDENLEVGDIIMTRFGFGKVTWVGSGQYPRCFSYQALRPDQVEIPREDGQEPSLEQ